MKTSQKLRDYFGAPSTMLEALLKEVEHLEAELEDSLNEYEAVGKAVYNLDEGQGIARGDDMFFLISKAAGVIECGAHSPTDLVRTNVEHRGPEFDQGELDPVPGAESDTETDIKHE